MTEKFRENPNEFWCESRTHQTLYWVSAEETGYNAVPARRNAGTGVPCMYHTL